MQPDFTPLFLDTAYVYALVNTRDAWHERAVEWQQRVARERRRLVTTQLILIEIADGLAAVRFRAQAAHVLDALQANQFIEVAPAPHSYSSPRLLFTGNGRTRIGA